MDGVWHWFQWLADTTGINLSIVYDGFDRRRFLLGMLTTAELSLAACLVSIVVGLVGAWLQRSRLRTLNGIVQAYVALFRNTPPLIQLYFFFFVIGGMLRIPHAGGAVPLVGSFWWAVISLSFYFGSFNIEIFRAGIESVPRATFEAAEALGYTAFGTFVHVVLPLAVRVSLPALGNNLVGLVKGTSLAYAIAVPEVLYVSSEIWSDQLNVPEMMTVLLVFYVVIVGLLVYGLKRLERAMRIPGYGQAT